MKLFFIFTYICFIVLAKKHRNQKNRNVSTSSSESDEYIQFTNDFLDLRGGIRRYFALEAALADHGRNMICSPLSVLMPLGKLAIGARRKAKAELLDAIGVKTGKQIMVAFAQLITNMRYLPGVTLDVASRIYVSSEKSINDNFKERTKLIFRSSIQKIDPYHPKETAAKINNWVASKTRNKIKKLFSTSDISRDTSMILVNAVYFQGKWKHRFDRSFTGDFYSTSGVRRLPMMSRQGYYKYWKCDTINAEVIEIQYEGSQAAMIIVLPYTNTGLTVLLRTLKLSPKLLNEALERMTFQEVILTMPKFKIESEIDLKPLYKKIGIKSIFDSRNSDLSGIVNDENLYVSTAIHKAVIEVNEKGTEAAAATGLLMLGSSPGAKQEPIRFEANRPFLFYVTIYSEQLFGGVFCE